MTENALIYLFMLIACLSACVFLFIEHKRIIVKRKARLLETEKQEVIRLIDTILYYLSSSSEIAITKQKNIAPETKEILTEYLDCIIGLYNICGICCRDLHLTEAEITCNFGKYIALLKEDKALLYEINLIPDFYQGVEYLLKICR